jgi:molybdopterin synthase sulfur carrier subunit
LAEVKVTVRFFTTLREIVGKGEEKYEVKVTDLTVGELLKQLEEKYGKPFQEYVYDEKGEVKSYLQLLVNGRSITTLQGMETKLKEGDTLAIIPPVGGG